MEQNLKNAISVYCVLRNCFRQFLEFEREFCLGLLGNVSRDLYLPISTIIHHKTFVSNLSRLFCQNEYTTFTLFNWNFHLLEVVSR